MIQHHDLSSRLFPFICIYHFWYHQRANLNAESAKAKASQVKILHGT